MRAVFGIARARVARPSPDRCRSGLTELEPCYTHQWLSCFISTAAPCWCDLESGRHREWLRYAVVNTITIMRTKECASDLGLKWGMPADRGLNGIAGSQ